MKTARVLFTLSMPGRSSWDGRWSGQDKNYQVVRTLDVETVGKLFKEPHGFSASKSWSHRWSDGWCASIDARILTHVDRLKKSDGFNGYEWMVDNIIAHGTPYGEVTS